MDILEQIRSLLDNVKKTKPLVHCITNYVTATDCANIILAIGGSPTMADFSKEVEAIAGIAQAVELNMGIINDDMVEAMIIAGKKANACGIPVVFDPVGAGVAPYRNSVCERILKEVKMDIIRGNISEIKFISGVSSETKGVDASESDMKMSNEDKVKLAQNLANKLNCTVAITGVEDIVTDGERSVVLHNGSKLLASVTGTGCMTSSLCGAYAGAGKDYFIAAIAAVLSMGISGEISEEANKEKGLGSFHVGIIDSISKLNYDVFKERAKITEIIK